MALSALCLALACCASGKDAQPEITSVYSGRASNYVKSNPVANSLEESVEEPPFSSYTYDFKVYENNYMLTVDPDDKRTGLVLTLEDKDFGFSTFNVIPPDGYVVNLPYSQNDASTVCTVIKGTENENSLPDLLKIDFYLASFEDESLPYSVSRLYTVSGGTLKEFKVYDMRGGDGSDERKALGYIPESDIFQPETGKFMADPKVTQNDDGSLEASIVTYTLDMDKMEIYCRNEPCTIDSPLYYGYAAYAVAGNIYRYFKDTSLNVSDYENYVEVMSADGNSSQYFFKVDDPRFSTVAELRSYAEKYFDKSIVDEMFLSAPQQYRDIDGELYTIVGDGGYNATLGRIFITELEENDDGGKRIMTYRTKQEKFNEEHELTGYVDGGDFTLEINDSETGFLITRYRYPNS